jgi:hypothetical protein
VRIRQFPGRFRANDFIIVNLELWNPSGFRPSPSSALQAESRGAWLICCDATRLLSLVGTGDRGSARQWCAVSWRSLSVLLPRRSLTTIPVACPLRPSPTQLTWSLAIFDGPI